jgi:hypothetical protein
MSAAATPAPERAWKSEKVDEAQALARSCAARRPDFQPCDGLSICATHSHGKCFKLHWCCHLGWCHCKSARVSFRPSAVVWGAPQAGASLGCGPPELSWRATPGAGAALATRGNPGGWGGENLAVVIATKGDLPVPGKPESPFPFLWYPERPGSGLRNGGGGSIDAHRRGSLFSGTLAPCRRLCTSSRLSSDCCLKRRSPGKWNCVPFIVFKLRTL